MNKKLLENYIELQGQISALEEAKETMRVEILNMMRSEDLEEVKMADGSGTFSIDKRKKWKYTPAVESLAKELKAKQTEEQQTGVAIPEISENLRFSPPREDKDEEQ